MVICVVRKLAPEEQEVLRKAKKSFDAFTRDRTRIILFSAERKSCGEIASNLGCDVRKIRSAIKDFNQRGLAALQRGKAKAAEPKFTDAVKKGILTEFSRKPCDCGYHYTTWTLPRFRKHLVDSGVVESISIETVRQVLMQSGARLKRSKRWQYSPDKDFDKKKQAIEQAIACPPPQSVILSVDAKGRTAVKVYGGCKYVFNGYYHTPYGQKVKGVCDLFAARNIHTGEIHYCFYDWKNSFIVTEFLQMLLQNYPDQTIYIICDGWSAHTSNYTQAFIDLHPRLKLLPLPTRASWLNPIERDFSQIQRFVLNDSDFQSVMETMNAIGNFIEKELSSN